jgi:hypothetical protein
MKASVSALALVGLAGCIQPTGPVQRMNHVAAPRATTSISGGSRLILSVQASPHVLAAGGSTIGTIVIRSTGSEPVAFGPTGPDGLVLALYSRDGQRLQEARFGFERPTTIVTNNPVTAAFEVAVFDGLPDGTYLLTLLMPGRDVQSLPCMIQIASPEQPGQTAAR